MWQPFRFVIGADDKTDHDTVCITVPKELATLADALALGRHLRSFSMGKRLD